MKEFTIGKYDLNKDGVVDTLCFEWNGCKALFISEDGKLPAALENVEDYDAYFNEAFNAHVGGNPWNPIRTGWGSYTLLIDRDGCGRFDTQGDWCYRAFDINGDGLPEAEYYHLFPGQAWCPWSNKLVVNLNGEPDMSYLDFKNFTYANEQEYGPGGKYYMNVHGSGFFVNSYAPNPRLSWETPIAWYDFNRDGRTEMTMRVGDTWHNTINCSGGLKVSEENPKPAYSGYVSEFEVAYELNGNTSEQRYHSLDLQLSFYRYKTQGPDGLDYQPYADKIPFMKALPGSEELHGAMADARLEVRRSYLPYMDGYRIGMAYPKWEGVIFLMDEDDDDCRWEEMFSNHEGEGGEPGWQVFGDQLGDRTEVDSDYQGKGMLYVAPFDGRIHLYHSEYACWEQDPYALYKGSKDHPVPEEGPVPPKGLQYTQVRYYDTTGDGYIDTVEYALARYGTDERKVFKTVSLGQYAGQKPELFDPRSDKPLTGWKIETWDGNPLTDDDFADTPALDGYQRMQAFYAGVCRKMAEGALQLYETAAALGLTKHEFAGEEKTPMYTREELEHLQAYPAYTGYAEHVRKLKNQPDLRSMYNDGYWLREKVFLDICESFDDKDLLEMYYYTGQYTLLCDELKKRCGAK